MDLKAEGLWEELLDEFQPEIVIQDWWVMNILFLLCDIVDITVVCLDNTHEHVILALCAFYSKIVSCQCGGSIYHCTPC